MQSWNGVAALAIIVASSLPAQAAPPQVSGKYAAFSVALCSARIRATATGVRSTEGGVLNVSNGYMTFTPSSATAGNAVLALTQVRGPNTTVNAPNSGWQQKPFSGNGSYTLGNSTMVLAGDTWIASYANIVGGIAKTINLSRRETDLNPDCVDGITLTRTH
jgi:hypothetical protein